jgi:hypothetical protein
MGHRKEKHCQKCRHRRPIEDFMKDMPLGERSPFCTACRRTTKICRKCDEEKSIVDFAGNRGGEIGFCKSCYSKARASLNERARARADARWRKRYGEERPKGTGRIDQDPEEILKAPGRRRAARMKAARRAPVDRVAIFERDGWLCGICGEPVRREDATLDHIVPIARGGTHEPSNVRLAHGLCNSRRGARPADTCRSDRQSKDR